MEPKQQAEIQLGHMCNNRCVFCVSGQRTGLGEALPLPTEPMLASIQQAWDAGNRKITLLGGEPTLQPGFMDVVRKCVDLGFEEIVLFTNGVKTARASFIEEIIATGGNFTWRISIQGANEEHHERTTRKVGSFGRIVRTMETLKRLGERLTVNMCVVRSNCESVDEFPGLLLPMNCQQLHLDMVRPADVGERTKEEMRAMIPRYSDLAGPFTRMVKGFPEGFDVNVGNLPYCIAPEIAPWIHHDGEMTYTVAIDGDDKLSEPWDKYANKRKDKVKPEGCRTCLFDDRCSGVYDTYVEFYGTDELIPITREILEAADPTRRLLSLHLEPVVAGVLGMKLPAPFESVRAEERGERHVALVFEGPGGPLDVVLGPPGFGAGSFEWFGVDVGRMPEDPIVVERAVQAVWAACALQGHRVKYPLGSDLYEATTRSVSRRLEKLRAAAPFGALEWTAIEISDGGRRAEARFTGPGGEKIAFWLGEKAGRPTGGYRLDAGEATDEVVASLREMMSVLRAPAEPLHAS